jgi:hypothetical protein
VGFRPRIALILPSSQIARTRPPRFLYLAPSVFPLDSRGVDGRNCCTMRGAVASRRRR